MLAFGGAYRRFSTVGSGWVAFLSEKPGKVPQIDGNRALRCLRLPPDPQTLGEAMTFGDLFARLRNFVDHFRRGVVRLYRDGEGAKEGGFRGADPVDTWFTRHSAPRR